MTGQIQVRCPECNASTITDRQAGDPVQAMEIGIICPACDDGDFHSPVYLAASGREVDWENPANRSGATITATF